MPLPIAHTAAGIAVYFSVPTWHLYELSAVKRFVLLGFLVFLSNAPDFDFLPGMLIDQPNYFHHAASHSIASIALISLGTWFICKTLIKGLSGGTLLLAFFFAAVSHIFLDFFSSDSGLPYGIPLLWPFSSEYFISDFPLFRDVVRSGDSTTIFFRSLINENNFWEIIIELTFLIFLISAVFLKKFKIKSRQFFVASSCVLGSLFFLYSIQIEPNWIEINEYDLKNKTSEQHLKIAHLSDLHLKYISFRESRIKHLLEENIKPDILVFTGDTFDPIGKNQKISLSDNVASLAAYVCSLPGEKFLVWGEGISDSRHQLNRFLSTNGVTVLEDESVISKNNTDFTVTGKLPELADFILTSVDNRTMLTANSTQLNSYLHLNSNDSFKFRDYEFTGEFVFSRDIGGMGITFYSQYTKFSDRFYRIRWSGSKPEPIISSHGTGKLSGDLMASTPLAFDTLFLFKVRAITNPSDIEIKAKFWAKDSPEPNEWNISASDSSRLRLESGTIGVWVNGSTGKYFFDNFKVTSLNEPHQILIKENFEDKFVFSDWANERVFKSEISPLKRGKIDILLAHSPEIVNDYNINNFDLILAGDTHGGQVCWPWNKPIIKNRELPSDWYSGKHYIENQMIYINRGLGTSRLPIRLFCRPEIAVFNF